MKQDKKHQGTLIKWKDDKGFGFIKPQQGTKEIFIHISALKGSARRPTVGDVILYQVTTEKDGKIKACHAEIVGVSSRSIQQQKPFQKPRKINQLQQMITAGIIGISLIILSIIINRGISSPEQFLINLTKPGCNIKGNISYNSGNKVYHVPGQKDYKSTIIDHQKGEKWFCTEAEAKAQGWQKAPE